MNQKTRKEAAHEESVRQCRWDHESPPPVHGRGNDKTDKKNSKDVSREKKSEDERLAVSMLWRPGCAPATLQNGEKRPRVGTFCP